MIFWITRLSKNKIKYIRKKYFCNYFNENSQKIRSKFMKLFENNQMIKAKIKIYAI